VSGYQRSARYLPISDYALIGDCHTAALVALDGSVDWYCLSRFDNPAVFCRLLDAERGGSLRLAPVGEFSSSRQYRGHTNVLETTFDAPSGRVRVTDLMPIYARAPSRAGYDVGTAQRLLRCVEGLAGDVELDIYFDPTFDFARAAADITVASDLGAVATSGGTSLVLACPKVAWEPRSGRGLRGRLRLEAEQRAWVALSTVTDRTDVRDALAFNDGQAELEQTVQYWDDWASQCTYRGPYRQHVVRSALALKLLDHEPSGAIIAAPTTSLPEKIGGERNWDYRYAWLRDSALMLYALMSIGYPEEAVDFFSWLDRVSGPHVGSAPQIMYGVSGDTDLRERRLEHLVGYRQSRPVRLGNAAASQRQLDVYGEILRAAYLLFRLGTGRRPPDETWTVLRWLVDEASAQWTEADHGIWEVRGPPRHFLNSKLMCWAAVDRGVRLALEHGLEAPVNVWRRTREEIGGVLLLRGYNADLDAFTQALDGSNLDAAALRIPIVGFLPATDRRVRSTVDKIRRELTSSGLVYRYRVSETNDGVAGDEGAFTLCSFWLVDALALGGRLNEASELFEQLLVHANDVGLLAEEIDPASGEMLGNFPQGFSHMGLINAAVNLAKSSKHGAEEQTETEAERADRAGPAAAEGHAGRTTKRPGMRVEACK